MGIAKVAESMQLCAYNLTINYYMVKLTNHKKAIGRPLSCKRWGIIAIIILFAGSLSFLLYSYFSHDADNPQCNCLLCMLNHVHEEGEYIYNRYLIFISFIWIAVIFAAVFLVNYCFVKKNKKKWCSFKYLFVIIFNNTILIFGYCPPFQLPLPLRQ